MTQQIVPFYGMRGTGDWVTDQRPLSWRKMILRQFPNGSAPLTAMLSMMKSEMTTDPQFHWWTKQLPLQATDLSDDGLYTDADLTTAYVSGGVTGSILYAKFPEANGDEFREGHQVTLRDSSNLTVDCVAFVTDRVLDGANSYLRVRLLEDDDNGTTGFDLSDADRMLVTGNANAEGAGMPDSIVYKPVKWWNYTQIFRTPLEITGTAMETMLRTNPQAYEEEKRDILELHSIEMEKAFWWGVPSERTGENNKPIRTMLGIIPAIRGGYTGHGGITGSESNYATDADFAGRSWAAGGIEWLNKELEVLFRYGKRDKMAFVGSVTLSAINTLVQNTGDFSFMEDTMYYGIKVKNWTTPQGTIGLIQHPLFTHEPTTRKIMVVIEPEMLKYRFIRNRDTKFIRDGMEKMNTGYTRRDGMAEEYLTECSLEYHFPNAWGYLTGFGDNNTLS